jgi:hypothetical protein
MGPAILGEAGSSENQWHARLTSNYEIRQYPSYYWKQGKTEGTAQAFYE